MRVRVHLFSFLSKRFIIPMASLANRPGNLILGRIFFMAALALDSHLLVLVPQKHGLFGPTKIGPVGKRVYNGNAKRQ